MTTDMQAVCNLTLELVRMAHEREPFSPKAMADYCAETLGALLEAVHIEATTNADLGLARPAHPDDPSAPTLHLPGLDESLAALDAFQVQSRRVNGKHHPQGE
jgi:hypothetical protein